MILSKEKRNDLAKKLDDLIKLPAWAEPFDKLILKLGFDYLDEHYGHLVPEKFVDDVNAAVDAFIDDDYEGILNLVPGVINDLVDIPGLDEDFEGKFLAINLQAAFQFIKFYAEKKK